MTYQIKRSGISELEWHVYRPSYAGEILLIGGLYRAQPRNRRWKVAHFSEIGLAADYIAATVA